MMQQIKNRRGRLTAYGFACGYQEVHQCNLDNRVRMYAEHGCYQVVGFQEGKLFRRSTGSLKEAREFYNRMKKTLDRIVKRDMITFGASQPIEEGK